MNKWKTFYEEVPGVTSISSSIPPTSGNYSGRSQSIIHSEMNLKEINFQISGAGIRCFRAGSGPCDSCDFPGHQELTGDQFPLIIVRVGRGERAKANERERVVRQKASEWKINKETKPGGKN
ncbi:hypothetical protein RUM43_012678 [Polyplax serrata]|uniref:Uncharacterized protein n=1 Tax=Polyplax serrata TaxID=468196 RepID=A0AAN8Q316_POLSC